MQKNVGKDEFCFGTGKVAHSVKDLEHTKQSLVSITTRFFSPIGVVNLVKVLFKMFCQQLCEEKIR